MGLHRQTVKPFATTHLCRLFFDVNVWFDGPWRRHSLKRRQHHEDAMAARTTKGPNKQAFWTLPCGTMWKSFLLSPKSKSDSVFLWSHNSLGHKARCSRPSCKKLPTSVHTRDDVEQTPPLRTPACNRSDNHLQHKKTPRAGSDANSI